jgi:hypothetical protein
VLRRSEGKGRRDIWGGKFIGFPSQKPGANSVDIAKLVIASSCCCIVHHVQRVSAKHGVKDDFAFLWEHAIFRHPPNKNSLTDRSENLHS